MHFILILVADDLVQAVLYVASDDTRNVTGTRIFVTAVRLRARWRGSIHAGPRPTTASQLTRLFSTIMGSRITT
jgi:hypothetical protein